MNYLRSLQI